MVNVYSLVVLDLPLVLFLFAALVFAFSCLRLQTAVFCVCIVGWFVLVVWVWSLLLRFHGFPVV